MPLSKLGLDLLKDLQNPETAQIKRLLADRDKLDKQISELVAAEQRKLLIRYTASAREKAVDDFHRMIRAGT